MAKNSFSVLIVDDEKIDRDAYRLMLSRCMPSLRVIGEAENGMQAVRFSCEHKPDLILMDIEMPTLSGIEAIRLLRAEQLSINFVIISAYDHFEYAKEALDLGVLGFLVKPVSEAELTREMERVVAILSEKQNRLIAQMDVLESGRPTLSKVALLDSLFYAIRANVPSTVHTLADLYGRDISSGVVVIALAEEDVPEAFISWLQKGKVPSATLLWHEGPMLTFLWNSNAESDLLDSLEYLYAEIRSYFRVCMHFFAGGKYASLRDINRSFMQAVSLMDSDNVIRVYDPIADAHRKYPYPFDRELSLLENLQHGNRERCTQLLADMIEEVDASCARGNFEKLKFVMYELLMTLNRQEFRSAQAGDAAKLLERNRYSEISDGLSLKAYFLAGIDALIGSDGQQAGSEKMRPILDYIRSHYNRDIPLSSLARRFYFSQGYLGRLLREITGLSYTEIVTRLRIERAAELLLNTQNSIGEISAEVGYKDANYFTKVFKKVTGRTPQNYRLKKP